MKKVTEWRHTDEEDKQPLHYSDCGLDDVYLMSGYEIVKTNYGEGLKIKNLEALHAAIGEYLACHKKALSGKELRYLRRQMDLTQSEIGLYVGLTSQQVARWEKEQSQISEAAESLIRILYLGVIRKRVNVKKLLDTLGSMDTDADGSIRVFEETEEGWKPAKAA